MTVDLGPEDARRLLLEGLVDYAGLFPPAALSMADAVAAYAEYRTSANAWALGKFVLPVARLDEFEALARPPGRRPPWQLALIAGPDFSADIRVIEAFARRAAQHAIVRAIEVRATTVADIGTIATNAALLRVSTSGAFDVYVEVPVASDPSALVESIAAHGLRAKVRTGGVDAGAFPDAGQLCAFRPRLRRTRRDLQGHGGAPSRAARELPAHLRSRERHAARCSDSSTCSSPRCSRARDSMMPRCARSSRSATRRTSRSVPPVSRGADARFPPRPIRRARAGTAVSFGSCSFTEPVADLSSLGLL